MNASARCRPRSAAAAAFAVGCCVEVVAEVGSANDGAADDGNADDGAANDGSAGVWFFKQGLAEITFAHDSGAGVGTFDDGCARVGFAPAFTMPAFSAAQTIAASSLAHTISNFTIPLSRLRRVTVRCAATCAAATALASRE